MSEDLIKRSDAIGACAYETIECCEARKAIRALPSAEPKTGGWIPCSERLPEREEQVLIYAESVHYVLAKYKNVRKNVEYTRVWVTADAYNSMCEINHNVIAWMPLPEPYSIESDGIKEGTDE